MGVFQTMSKEIEIFDNRHSILDFHWQPLLKF